MVKLRALRVNGAAADPDVSLSLRPRWRCLCHRLQQEGTEAAHEERCGCGLRRKERQALPQRQRHQKGMGRQEGRRLGRQVQRQALIKNLCLDR